MSMSKEDTETGWTDPGEIPDLSTPEWEETINAAKVSRGRPKR